VAIASDLLRDGAVVDAALAEFLAADIVVIGAPMYNFSIPSQLKSWIDSITVAGKTFSYSAAGVTGLCGGKRIIVASSRGGIYTGSSPMASLDYQEAYLRGIFSFLGVTDIAFVRAEGINYGLDHRQRALESALAEVAMLKAS
jgi:FMN-dependent NADH-azoreductase